MSEASPVVYQCYDCGRMFQLSERGEDVSPSAELLTAVVLMKGVRDLFCAVCHKKSLQHERG